MQRANWYCVFKGHCEDIADFAICFEQKKKKNAKLVHPHQTNTELIPLQ
jgi:hypothetical protein